MKNVEEVGFVQSVQGEVLTISDLPGVRVGEMVVGESGEKGYVGGLFSDQVKVFLLAKTPVEPGEMWRRTGKPITINVGNFLLGRVIDPLGQIIDGQIKKKSEDGAEEMAIDQEAVGIKGRRFIKEQFDTGIVVIDTVFPLGKGQRELILTESRAGQGEVFLDIIANAASQGILCIYALIGRPVSQARAVWADLVEKKILAKVILLISTSTDPAPMVFLAPYAAMAVAGYFQRQGKDVLVILDDMGTHARNYREMTLLAGGAPGRESYPGDIFYQHAKIVERAGCFDPSAGGGSITLLPVLELSATEFTSFIPTNLMGMTDGHLLFKSALAQQGRRPAVDLFFSVTRVGGQTQQRLQNALATKIKEVLIRGQELETVGRLGAELPLETRQILAQKEQIEELLNQKPLTLIPKELQMVLLGLTFTALFKGKDRGFVKSIRDKVLTEKKFLDFSKDVFKKKNLEELFAALESLNADH